MGLRLDDLKAFVALRAHVLDEAGKSFAKDILDDKRWPMESSKLRLECLEALRQRIFRAEALKSMPVTEHAEQSATISDPHKERSLALTREARIARLLAERKAFRDQQRVRNKQALHEKWRAGLLDAAKQRVIEDQKIAAEKEKAKPKPATEKLAPRLPIERVNAMFDRATKYSASPSIMLADGQSRLTVKRSIRGGLSISTTRNGWNRTIARIDPSGRLIAAPDQEMSESLVKTLRYFMTNPAEAAAHYGFLVGRCAFCGKALTDPNSLRVGYGRTCAYNWGVPY